MRFRTKLLLTFLAVVLAINGLSLFYFYRSTRALLIGELREKVLSISTGAAAIIDGDLHSTIKTREDEGSTPYVQLRDVLRRLRDANRRNGTYVRYIYTLAPSPENPQTLYFVLDAEENPQNFSHTGDIYRYSGEPIHLGEAYADKDFSIDQWGTWLSAYAPIRNRDRTIVAMLGIDISAESVRLALMPLRIAAALSIGGALLLALIGGVALASNVSRPLLSIRETLRKIGTGDLSVSTHIHTRDEFGEVAAAIDEMVVGLRERQAVKSAFARYVSNQVLDSILESGHAPTVHGDRRKITVLFSDIRSFTTLAEKLSPEEVVQILNEYFAEMVEIVFRNKGTLDKFIGDGLMVIFGAPAEDPEQEKHAVQTAIEMQQAIHRLSTKWEAEGKSAIRAGIGIHSGTAIVGNIGSEERMEYTAIGDTVNLASRLESATKELGVDILISEETIYGTHDAFGGKKVGELHVKGRHEPVMTYTIGVLDAAAATSSSRA
jgi:adenylate cyclase